MCMSLSLSLHIICSLAHSLCKYLIHNYMQNTYRVLHSLLGYTVVAASNATVLSVLLSFFFCCVFCFVLFCYPSTLLFALPSFDYSRRARYEGECGVGNFNSMLYILLHLILCIVHSTHASHNP